LFVTTADGVVRRLAKDDGSVVWRHRLAGIPVGGVVVHGDQLVALLADGRMELLEAASGESTVHSPTTEMPAGPPIVTERRLYVATLSGTLMAWDRDKRRSLWRARVPSSPVGMLALHEGQLLLALEDGSVVSVNAKDGERVWEVSPGIVPSTGPTASRESLYVAGRDGTVRALALDDGRTLWTYNAESPLYQPLAVFEDTVILALQSGEIRAVSEASVRWESDVGDAPAAGPTLAGDTLYIPTLGGELHAMDARDGSVRFRFPLRGASREVVPFTRDGEPQLAVGSASGMVGVLGEGVFSSQRTSGEPSEESSPQGADRSSTDGDAAPGAAGEGVGEGAGDGAATETAAREGITAGGDARMIQASVSNRSMSVNVDRTGVYEFRFPDQEQVPVVAELLDSAGVVISGNLDKAGLADSFRHRLDADREYSLRWRALRENVAGKNARVELRRLSNS
jgi:outer membrane protein assembly factor BamB